MARVMKQRRQQSECTTEVEVRDVDRAGAVLLVEDEGRDQVAAQEEEDGDAEAAWDRLAVAGVGDDARSARPAPAVRPARGSGPASAAPEASPGQPRPGARRPARERRPCDQNSPPAPRPAPSKSPRHPFQLHYCGSPAKWGRVGEPPTQRRTVTGRRRLYCTKVPNVGNDST